MASDQIIHELEATAQILLAPPNVITPQQRQSAEAIFLNFRKSKAPYQLCRDILEKSTVDYVLFESAGLIKEALVREWNLLPKNDIASLRQYLFHYIISKTTLAQFVKKRILQVIAIMIKRGSIEDVGEERGVILNEVENLILSGDIQRQILGCSMITALMQEYATTVKSSDVGLTWEVHFKAKKQFEVTDLKRIFKFSVSALSELTKNNDISETNLTLVKHLLSISEGVMVWGFIHTNLPKRLIGVFESVYESDSSPSLRLVPLWRDVILDPIILQVFFDIYWKVRTNLQLAHHARNCLVQLASLSGSVLSSQTISINYLTNYLQGFLKLVTNINIIDSEAIGIANIIRKLITFFGINLSSISNDLLQLFMEQTTRLTCIFAEGAAQEENIATEDCLYMEAFEKILDTWSSILSESHYFPTQYCQQSSIQIFNVYVKCHLSSPDGTRIINNNNINQEYDESEDDDKTKFKEQLQTMGVIGRQIPSHSLTLLSQLLENKTNKLRQELSNYVLLQQQQNNNNNTTTTTTTTTEISEYMKELYEDIHWLILLSGHVLCMESDGEYALIPSEIMKHSMEQIQQGQVNVNTTLQLLASPGNNINDIAGAEQTSDNVIRLISAVFRICEIEKTAILSNISDKLSPELSGTIVWFLYKFSLSYLIPIETYYTELSTTFLQAFGDDTPGALWITNYLLEKIELNINTFKGEESLIKDTLQLLLSLVERPTKASHFLKSDRLCNIIELSKKDDYTLTQTAKKGLIRAVVQAGSALQNDNRAEQYWSSILQPIQNRFKQIITNNNFSRSYHQEQYRIQITQIIETLIGVPQGVQASTVKSVFNYISPVLTELPNILGLYHNYQDLVQLILEFFCECTRRMLCYLPENESITVYQSCLNIIQAYSRCNTNRLTVDITKEQDTFQDILLLMQLLTNLLSKDLLDLSLNEAGASEQQQQQQPITPADVFLYGLNIVMPMMTVELLKFPALCHQYFKMITFVCEIYPKKVCDLPTELLRQLMASVELGLFSFGHEITVFCCDILHVVARQIYSETEEPKNQLLAPFLNLLMNLILSHQINSELVSNASIPLYYLICCYQSQYQELVQNFLAGQPDPDIAQRLATAFNDLTANIELNGGRTHKLKFRDNFDTFVVNVQGFMMVK